jgi:GTP-binding protein Era
MEEARSFKSGFVGLVGPTNSGKSTLINALVGRKVSIVSDKVQTTYHGVKGIVNSDREQVIFVDTPGFQRHGESVARLLNRVADRNAKDCDLLVWVFDASNARVLQHVQNLSERIRKLRNEARLPICVLNKVDKIAKPSLLPMIQALSATGLFSEIIPLSARTGAGLERLRGVLSPVLPEGQPLYPTDQITDRSQDFRITELIREKIYEATRQEIPYSAWIEVERWAGDVPEAKVPTIRAVIHVDSDSRKGILIGKQGEMLKRIGTRARQDIEKVVGSQICLKLHVDVQQGWKDNAHLLNQYLELE